VPATEKINFDNIRCYSSILEGKLIFLSNVVAKKLYLKFSANLSTTKIDGVQYMRCCCFEAWDL
jgi:hypothetical protein